MAFLNIMSFFPLFSFLTTRSTTKFFLLLFWTKCIFFILSCNFLLAAPFLGCHSTLIYVIQFFLFCFDISFTSESFWHTFLSFCASCVHLILLFLLSCLSQAVTLFYYRLLALNFLTPCIFNSAFTCNTQVFIILWRIHFFYSSFLFHHPFHGNHSNPLTIYHFLFRFPYL